jgi:hypothetical protein
MYFFILAHFKTLSQASLLNFANNFLQVHTYASGYQHERKAQQVKLLSTEQHADTGKFVQQFRAVFTLWWSVF